MSNSTSIGQNMLLYTSEWNSYKTFKMLPLTPECPYVEGIFDPQSKVLVLISRTAKSSMHMLPKLDDNGDVATLKLQVRTNGKKYKEERKVVDTFLEYYVTDKEEIERIIKLFAANYAEYDIKPAMEMVIETPKEPGSVLQLNN